MPGPWVAGSDNPGFLPGMSWKIKQLYEVITYSDVGTRQGKLLVEVIDAEATTKFGKWLDVRVVAIEDAYLGWWFSSGDGRDLDYEVRLHICAGPFEDCRKVDVTKHNEFHTDVVRKIDVEDVRNDISSWWLKSGSKARYAEWKKEYLSEFKEGPKTRKRTTPSEDALDFGLSEEDKERPDKEPEGDKKDERDDGLRKKLRELKEHAKKKEKTKVGKAKEKKEAKVGRKDKKEREPSVGLESSSSHGRVRRERSKKRAFWFGRERKDAKRRSTSSRDKDRGAKKKEKKKSKKSSSSTSTSEKKKRRKKRKEKREDRGPYGSGRRVKYGGDSDGSCSDSDDSSVFQGGVPDKKAHQLILQEYAEKRPGRLTARMLQKMTSLMSRSGTPASQLNPVQDRTPPVATPYLLTVILPTYREKMTMRLLRELKTLSYALDFLALGQGERASDILAQRMKALELVLSDQGWNRAQFLELIPPEGAGLVDPEEQRMASKEQALDAKLKSFLPAGWKKNDGGKGDEKGGKAGKKGKGLGKNDKSDWKKDGARKEEQKAPAQ